jgi:hypothetical protein
MIAFAPFSNEPPQPVLMRPQPQLLQIQKSGGCTECNMLVLAFVAGIFLMAIFDALK